MWSRQHEQRMVNLVTNFRKHPIVAWAYRPQHDTIHIVTIDLHDDEEMIVEQHCPGLSIARLRYRLGLEHDAGRLFEAFDAVLIVRSTR